MEVKSEGDSTQKEVGQPRGVFDLHHPPSEQLISDCVHCGFCLPACPTYALWGEEMDSPRGRIYLMKLGLDGEATMNETYVQHFDRCLGCMSCVTACPSGVQYDKLIEATRSQVERNFSRTFADKLFRRMLFELFPYPRRLRALSVPLWVYQRIGLQFLFRKAGLLGILPERLRAMERVMPGISLKKIFAKSPRNAAVVEEARGRVGMLLGCVQQIFFPDVNAATIRVLSAEGFQVVIPRQQGCCGALMVHAGHEEQARRFARNLIDTFENAEVDTIVINSAGCGSTMKEYGHLLRDEPEYSIRARAFAAKCMDISEFLVLNPSRAKRHPLPLRVAYHDACHLQHAQGVRLQPRQVLQSIPDLKVVEIPEGAICCGSAGIYNLVQPEDAQALGDRKVENILKTGAEAIVSSNPGCLLQIGSGLENAGRSLPVRHLVELLDASISGKKLSA